MYKHILIPTDGSNCRSWRWRKALPWRKHLMPASPYYGNGSISRYAYRWQYKNHMAAIAKQYLEEGKKIAATAGVECDLARVEHEHPYKAIIDTAQKQGCDAIHMASHGRSGISAVLLGSETLKVLTHSTIPVIVCRRPHLAKLVQDAFAS